MTPSVAAIQVFHRLPRFKAKLDWCDRKNWPDEPGIKIKQMIASHTRAGDSHLLDVI